MKKINMPQLLVPLVALIFWQLLHNMKEKPIEITTIENDESQSPVYNIIDLRGPSVSGRLLPLFSYVFSHSFLSPLILRSLVNKNGMHKIRELAVEKCQNLPPLFYPAHKATVTREMRELGELQLRNFVFQSGIEMDSSTSSGNTSTSSIMKFHNVYKSGAATPSQVMEEVIIGAEKLSHLKIFSSFQPDDIRTQAQASDKRWKEGKPLSVFDGVPIAIKDMSSIIGHRVCRGSIQVCREEATEDDTPAHRLRSAGAILVGLTVMVEGGVTPLGYNAHWDGPFNPYDTEYYPGGSSSGSAVAVASGLVPMALGWDGGGSIRIPAAMSGVNGLAVTQGRIPYNDGMTTTVTKAGPLAATIEDVALTHLLLGQVDPKAHYTQMIGEEYFPPPVLSSLFDSSGKYVIREMPLEGTRIGVFWDHFRHTDDEIYEESLKALKYLEKLGAQIVDISIPHLREIHLSHGITILSEFGIGWEREFYQKVLESNTQITVALGKTIKSIEVFAAAKVRRYAKNLICDKIFVDMNIDAIASPMLGEAVPKPGKGYRHFGETDNEKIYRAMRYAPLANFLGLPGLSVPIGYEQKTGLPIGFQLLGNAWTEDKLIDMGIHLEQRLERKSPPPKNYYDVLAKFVV
eukprot:CAMPEP_0203665404 /NCGR_PEP_ID=MMETSP0090-20130426/2614_1 /ASSEMBLY_ACC=CAM_ASM_001088 /TAXON_ID=426623 /ORGANISM="Chaetoceros affinis, Strain CCMP159" /LENGTH=630 /DNA_ID=CAMNT_0050528935 /DNA_START=1 /DNA_END=1893 /DNA_ORIENTATION=+